MQNMHSFQSQEVDQKKERVRAGTAWLKEWQATRQSQILQRRANNQLMQENAEKEAAEMKQSQNPWQRICANVEFTSTATTPSGKDVSRMKAAMLARKADLTQKQGSQAML